MVRPIRLTVLGCLASLASPAAGEPPVHFEVGLNARRFAASSPEATAAFRTVDGTSVEGTPAGAGVTMSLRFTKWMRWNTVAGFEAETGSLTERNSNVAGAYGLFGTRHEVGPVALFAELAAGKRWVRYSLMSANHNSWMVEPRVRAEMWLSDRFTLGGAIGSTLGADARTWMAGVYIGVHSLDFGKR